MVTEIGKRGLSHIEKKDPQVGNILQSERKRQRETLTLIPSENHSSRTVKLALSSDFDGKYAEGYPGRRYYQGQEYADMIENLAQRRAAELFHVPYVNVQPYSGSPANFEVLSALAQPGEVIMGLTLSGGGHLTHGASASETSHFFNSVQYETKPDGTINYDQLRELALQHRPKVIFAGTSAYAQTLDWKQFADIAKESGAFLVADISHVAGLIAGGVYPSPVEYADIVTTTTHKTLRGPRGAIIMVTEKGLTKDPELGKKIDKVVFPGLQGGPHLNTIAGIAVALREASTPQFADYARQTIANAKTLASELMTQGIKVVSEGTDSHLFLVDLRDQNISGKTVAEGLEKVGLVVNANAIPDDSASPLYPSGIRLGTPALTSRGMGEDQMHQVGFLIASTIKELSFAKERLKLTTTDEKKGVKRTEIISIVEPQLHTIAEKVSQLTQAFPIPEDYN